MGLWWFGGVFLWIFFFGGVGGRDRGGEWWFVEADNVGDFPLKTQFESYPSSPPTTNPQKTFLKVSICSI